MYIALNIAIELIEYPLSIKIPKIAVPVAVANTINPEVIALIPPIYFTP